jgi:hypothetical protein
MPAPSDIGISSYSDSLTQSVEREITMQEVVRKNADGGFGAAHAWNPRTTASIKVLGTSSEAVGAAITVSGLSGEVIVLEKTHTRTNDNFDETDLSVVGAPGAS